MMFRRRASSPVILFYAKLAISAPVDYFPINSQLPPVARISEPFSFVFSPLTFSSPDPISYSLVDSPGWLSIDSDGRRIYGLPTEQDVAPGDVVGVPISITATDGQGSTTANSTLVVSRNSPPQLNVPLSEQIPKFGPYSAPSSIILGPSRDFSFAFDANTFSPSGLNYYAVSGDNSPLPSWIQFNADSISFSGRTPAFDSTLEPPQSFGVQLVASDVAGFSSTFLPFSIVVSNHELTADTPVVMLNATQGTAFGYSDLPEILKLDDKQLDRSSVSSVTTTELPGWLQFDTETWGFNGTPGLTASSTNVTISIVDTYSDSLNVTLVITVDTGIFRSGLPALNVSAGTKLAFDLKPYFWNPSDIELQIDDESQAPWIRFDSSEFELLGTVPVSASAVNVDIQLEAKSKTTQVTESQKLSIRIAGAKLTSTSSSSKPATQTSTPATSPTTAATSVSGTSLSRTNKIILAVVLPLVVVGTVALVIIFCCLRKRRRELGEEHIPTISVPIKGSFIKHDTSSFEGGALNNMFDIGFMTGKRKSKGDAILPAAFSKVRTFSSDPSLCSSSSSTVPHAVTFYAFDYRRSLSDSAVRETRESWLAGQTSQRRQSTLNTPRTERTNGESPLSNTSFVTGDQSIHATSALVISATGPDSFRRSLVTSPVAGIGVPVVHEPFNKQAAPETARIAGGKGRDGDSSMRSPGYHDSTYSTASGLGIQRPGTETLQTASTRVSNAWKQASPSGLLDEYKRKSNTSTSTVQTTRTSILTKGASIEDPATVSVMAKPTVINVPSRSGESRQISRRVGGESSLFGGGGPTMRSPKNFSVNFNTSPKSTRDGAASSPHSNFYDTSPARDSDSSAQKSQSSLSPSKRKEREERSKRNERELRDLMLPEQWPKPGTSESPPRPTATKPSIRTVPYQPPEVPVTPKNPKGKSRFFKRGSRDSSRSSSPSKGSTASRPHSTSKRKQKAVRDERLRMSRLREKQALEEFKAAISNPDPAWLYPTPRPLPETPVRPSRSPLPDRMHVAEASGSSERRGLRNRFSMLRKSNKSIKSIKSIKSFKSFKSSKSGKSEYAETEDGWEDVRPESAPGAEFFGSSTENVPAFI